VIVTRPSSQAAATMLGLVDAGFAPRSVPAIAIESLTDGPLAAVMTRLGDFDWIVVTSANAVAALRSASARGDHDLRALSHRGSLRWAAVGGATERALTEAGIRVIWRPSQSRAAKLAVELPIDSGERVLLPRGDLADDEAPALLRSRGAVVETVVAYRTLEGPEASVPCLAAALAGRPVATILASPSGARGLLALADALGPRQRAAVAAIPVVAIGPATAIAARENRMTVLAMAGDATPADIAAATAAALRPALETP
jgi:uroporphyrinogen-III synthase